jgi:hypothetical protein
MDAVKYFTLIIIMALVCSCGDPVDADDNIIRKKIQQGLSFAFFAETSIWGYDVEVVSSRPQMFSVPSQVEVKAVNLVQNNDTETLELQAGPELFEYEISNNTLTISKDVFEEEFTNLIPGVMPMEFRLPLDEKKSWADDNWSYEISSLQTSLPVGNISYDCVVIECRSALKPDYIKTIYFNSDKGIIKASYEINRIDLGVIGTINFSMTTYSR